MSRWDHHPPCPNGCGELADECACPNPNPLGSMSIEPAIGSRVRADEIRSLVAASKAVAKAERERDEARMDEARAVVARARAENERDEIQAAVEFVLDRWGATTSRAMATELRDALRGETRG